MDTASLIFLVGFMKLRGCMALVLRSPTPVVYCHSFRSSGLILQARTGFRCSRTLGNNATADAGVSIKHSSCQVRLAINRHSRCLIPERASRISTTTDWLKTPVIDGGAAQIIYIVWGVGRFFPRSFPPCPCIFLCDRISEPSSFLLRFAGASFRG